MLTVDEATGQKSKSWAGDVPLPLDGDVGHSRASFRLQLPQDQSESFNLNGLLLLTLI